MTHKEAFDKYSEELVKCLPMNDTLFIAKLSTFNLLPGNINDQLQALLTQADKAVHLLNNVIKLALAINDTSSFENLLSIMEECGYDHMKRLACIIKSQISKGNNMDSGTYVYMYTVRLCTCTIPYKVRL